MFIANHFFVRIGVSAYSNNQKNKFYSTITITSIIMPTFTSHLKYDSTMEIIFYFCINLIKSF